MAVIARSVAAMAVARRVSAQLDRVSSEWKCHERVWAILVALVRVTYVL
jgi:hypothetical protein